MCCAFLNAIGLYIKHVFSICVRFIQTHVHIKLDLELLCCRCVRGHGQQRKQHRTEKIKYKYSLSGTFKKHMSNKLHLALDLHSPCIGARCVLYAEHETIEIQEIFANKIGNLLLA